jgi:hypothetical protein
MRRIFLLIAAALLAVSLVQAAPAAANAGDLAYLNLHNGYCLSVEYSSTANGAAINQWRCLGGTGSASQHWYARPHLTADQYGFSRIVNRNSGKCLSVADRNTAEGAAVIQWGCIEGDGFAQAWSVEPINDLYGGVRIRNYYGWCLAPVAAASTTQGTHMVQRYCDPNDSSTRWSEVSVS